MEQLDYLFTHNQPHSYSELNSLVEEVMNMHQKFIQSDEEMIKSYGIEQERLLNFFLNHHIISSKSHIFIHDTCFNIEETT